MGQRTEKIDQESIVAFLSEIELFKKLNESALKDFANSLSILSVEGGTTLIQQGDKLDKSMFILYQGRLRVYKREDPPSDKEIMLAEISAGEFVGEIALLTDLPRTKTVRAVRDSIILKLDEKAYKQFEKEHPHEVVEIAKTALTRLAIKPRSTQIGENITTVAIAPAGNSNSRSFIERLVKQLNKLKPTILINKEICNRHFGKDISDTKSHEDYLRITAWLHTMESQYGYIIYETDSEMSPWTQRCIRQADRLIFVAEPTKSTTLNSIESLVLDKSKIWPYTEIVFVHPDEQKIIVGTGEWLKGRFWYGFHHIRLNSQTDYDRLIRFLTGRAFGVVLNGGGARGFIHAGVLKALDELKIPVDFIAGTSMGAVMAGVYASSNVSEMIKYSDSYARTFRQEWTLPIIALLKGKFNCDFYQSMWDDTCIEDLWIRYFCVSTNVSQAKIEIHDQGKIWRAVRASTSIPAIYPPIYNEEGNMLVDGGIMNNMPVDIMRKMICGGKILAVNCHIESPTIEKKKIVHNWMSGWKLFFQKFNPFSQEKNDYDTIFNILMASMNVGLAFQQNQMEKEADYLLEFNTNAYNILDFHHANEIIEIGYRTSLEELPKLLRNKDQII